MSSPRKVIFLVDACHEAITQEPKKEKGRDKIGNRHKEEYGDKEMQEGDQDEKIQKTTEGFVTDEDSEEARRG